MNLFARWRWWRLRRAEMRLADAKYDLRFWGYRPGTKPSYTDWLERRVEWRKRRLSRLLASASKVGSPGDSDEEFDGWAFSKRGDSGGDL